MNSIHALNPVHRAAFAALSSDWQSFAALKAATGLPFGAFDDLVQMGFADVRGGNVHEYRKKETSR
jgi:hypothetical protein